MSTWQALLLGLLQGATELFPVSSLGHAVLLPSLLHWSYRQSDPSFVPFLVFLHLGTAAALLILYWRQWLLIVQGLWRGALRGRIVDTNERLAMYILVGTIPAGVVGFFLEKPLKNLFATPKLAAVFLAINGLILLTAEVLRRRDEARGAHEKRDRQSQEENFATVEKLSFRAAIGVGFCQVFALLPGISRSGITMAGGLAAGLRHTEAARFSFLLATPIIAAAGILEIPELFAANVPLGTYAIAALFAGIAAYASARFLLQYFRSGRLDGFGYYCIGFGVIGFWLVH